MLPITQDFIHINAFSRVGRPLQGKKGIVMHYTASPGAPAMNISHYFDSLKSQNPNDNEPDRYAGAHYSVDRYKIVQSIPANEEGYHTGSKVGYTPEAKMSLGAHPNKTTIGIEMCIEKDGSIHEDTFHNAADLVVYLIQHEGFPEVLFTHKGVVGWKDCPLPWVKKPSEFERFKRLVHAKLHPVTNPPIGGGKEQVKVQGAKPKMDAKDANTIINMYLKPAYGTAKPEDRKEIGRLADEIRIAAGLPPQNR